MSRELWWAFLSCVVLAIVTLSVLWGMCKQVNEDREQCGKQ